MPQTAERMASRYVKSATEQSKLAVRLFKVDPARIPDRAPVPHVRLSLPKDKVYGVVQLHSDPDREPTVLGVNSKGSVDIPTGAKVLVSMEDKEYLITDHTSSPQRGEGNRGVTISHGRRVSREPGHWIRRRNGQEEWVKFNRYAVTNGKHEWLGDVGELQLENVQVSYRTIPHDEAEKTQEVKETVVYKNAA